MREVKAVKINAADFAPYGTFCNMTEPEGYPLSGEIHKFYPDRISGTCVGSIAFSPIAVRKDDRIIKMAEYHTTTWEGIVALDDDMIIHVAPASGGTPVPELAKAFIVPKGCMVKINAAIWHQHRHDEIERQEHAQKRQRDHVCREANDPRHCHRDHHHHAV